ncbi:MAG: TetR/AcrR family transcriptional regulator; helix-turn-helix transcriptional regulator [Prevotella sp.]|jgi:AcrR family transcriptional regulator|nr:TetR/AcrR family transcriptional regulator; helix-turn-helix transcriptional regulator [Prevotella sp.]
MENISNAKLSILKDSYKLFLTNNIEKVTITELEKACNKIRGTIFYHFCNKQTLFESVVANIFFPSFKMPIDLLKIAIERPLQDFLLIYKNPEERVVHLINNKYEINEAEVSYYNFISQAYKYYPNFQNRFEAIMINELQILKSAISRAQCLNGYTTGKAEMFAYLFMLVGTGLTFQNGFVSNSSFKYNDYLFELEPLLFQNEA